LTRPFSLLSLSIQSSLAHLDLNPAPLCLAGTRSRRHRHHLPGRKPAMSAPLRAPHALHASKNSRGTFLNTSAADPAVADHQPPLGMRSTVKTLAPHVAPSCMRCLAEKKGRGPSDLDRTAAYQFGRARPGQAGGSGPAWLASAAPARSLFFSDLIFSFCKYLQDSKMDRNNSVGPKFVIQISLCS
jgi:hypothetical protein